MGENETRDAGVAGEWEQFPDRASFVARYNATFDFEAGWADVCRRARRAAPVSDRPPGPGSPP